MAIEIRAKNPKTTAIYRFVGRDIFLKCNNMQYAAQLIAQIQSKGGKVKQGRGWMQCDIYGDNQTAKLGEWNVDLEEDSPDEIEKKASSFFKFSLEKANFKVEVKEI